ncbi:hypothetical protein AVEN_250825-1 [Araneus ventricosus]|uniref:Uncharacterized protein n=1 Tax=Araneus ventricosus TaxID=182803 RepID=A0A4Y2MG30_ARAVE|nr:hypothetical protein AVEN_250825-1 [Araneus ventricosus]
MAYGYTRVKLERERFSAKQSTENVYHFIVNSAIAAAEEHKDAVLMREDIDLLIIFTASSSFTAPSTNSCFLETRERKLTDQPLLCQQF